MASVIASRPTSLVSLSNRNSTYVPPSPIGSNASASSSSASLDIDDDGEYGGVVNQLAASDNIRPENVTITANRTLFSRKKEKSQE